MEVTGILKVKMDVKQVSEKFKSREFVLTTEAGGNYPQQVIFQLAQDRCALIDNYNIGDDLRVQFNLRGREWKSPQGEVKYFNTIEAWKIEKTGAPVSVPKEPAAKTNVSQQATSTTSSETFSESSNSDEIPF